MTSVEDLDVLEHFHYSTQVSGEHSSATVPLDKVHELTCMIKVYFIVYMQIFSVGLSDLDLEDWPFMSLRKKKKRNFTKRFE